MNYLFFCCNILFFSNWCLTDNESIEWEVMLKARKDKSDYFAPMQFATLFSDGKGMLLSGGGSDLHQNTSRPTLFRSLDDGINWAPVFVGKKNQFSLYAFQELANKKLIGIVPDSLLYSSDYGKTWIEKVMPGTGLSMNQGNGVLLVSKNPNELYRSTDNGETFNRVRYSYERGCDNLRAISFVDGVFYIGVGDESSKTSRHARVFRSIDLGMTWTKIFDQTGSGSEPFIVFSIFAVNKDCVLIGTGGTEQGKASIYKTIDGGKRWAKVLSTADIDKSITIVRSFYRDPDNKRLYVLLDCSYASSNPSSDEPDNNTNSCILFSTDEGNTWKIFSKTHTKRLYWMTKTKSGHLLCSTGEYGQILRSAQLAPS
ncbi:uncharacterized protein MONOS_114 [Monocercomonoides exilis]|uniref:uncharacterized protein n=1 Tax=Monocercomonoides exilis TaxID=2049356 RepID=UPI00355988BA|nr:hypothetical protein MONOS_114 [Monocercomonoides exilis]|eukprot:MONOS_114.1-p1 / transcript=MONOS_114.1 / gene=MONOS_114 / organism=Monocercomonoides_exilis_PA203 / gene_product=unspecified product / transcript_product=unspecified product / location=Mono_scaffold00002:173859-174971(-) / protein_length=371 / sequence_SO=supercontig / SO=protein_coding / is_pseudo=false